MQLMYMLKEIAPLHILQILYHYLQILYHLQRHLAARRLRSANIISIHSLTNIARRTVFYHPVKFCPLFQIHPV